jgi:hypothetical protein
MRRLLRGIRDRFRRVKSHLAGKIRNRRVARAMEPVPGLPPRERLAGSTLFFVPYAGVTPMLSEACVLGRTLAERGHAVFFARCFRLFERCPVMDMHRLPYDAGPEQKLETCLKCADNSLSMLGDYGLDAIDLRGIVGPEMLRRIDDALPPVSADLFNFEFDGQPFGRICLVDVVLSQKIAEFSGLSPQDRLAWRQYVRSSLVSYLMVDRLCAEFQIGRIAYVADYSLLLGARLAAGKHGVPCYSMQFPGHCNVDLRRYIVLSNIWKPFSFKMLAAWPSCRELCLEPERVREVADDLIVRMGARGAHIYSPAKSVAGEDVRSRLGLAHDRRLLVAFTSSLDEVLASQVMGEALGLSIPDRPQPFSDQIEWLKAVTAYVEQSDDLALVVRVHPREGANKRESVVSQHLARLKEAFGGAYAHCRFVWPEDPTSSYDLGEAADLVLTSWSTIGLEMARMGVPVLVAFNGAGAAIPWDDFLEWAPTADEYLGTMRRLLDRAVSLFQVARAFRWYNLHTLGTSVDLTDLVPRPDFAGLPPYKTPREAATIERMFIDGKDICEINIERLQAMQRTDSLDRESAELRRQLGRLIDFLMTGEIPTEMAPLSLVAPGEAPAQFPAIRLERAEIEYWPSAVDRNRRPLRRRSPMVARLATLCGEAERLTAGVRSS